MAANQEDLQSSFCFFSGFTENVWQVYSDIPHPPPPKKRNSVYLYCKVYKSIDIQCWLHEIKDELYMVSQGKMIWRSWGKTSYLFKNITGDLWKYMLKSHMVTEGFSDTLVLQKSYFVSGNSKWQHFADKSTNKSCMSISITLLSCKPVEMLFYFQNRQHRKCCSAALQLRVKLFLTSTILIFILWGILL